VKPHHPHSATIVDEVGGGQADNAERREDHFAPGKMAEGHKGHAAHGDMIHDFTRRLIASAILTIPVLILSHHVQQFFGFSLRFPGSESLLFLLASVVYLYGGYPFFVGFRDELKIDSPV